ncbi:hypothetical protein CLIB1423_02S00826 [[Candida] railenensis]|uniref:PH-like domain-containing protein n=1 Tax=[Candida] railenensis TaxID=45579 RepID=A0A9P0QL21_9ASCO|nr:hypothetical protein CLIB1423_02S00826 [[Candida] railenensis]
MSYSPIDLLRTLLETEKGENDKLIEILGLVKPSKGTTSTLNSIIRGLFTKNSKLLALLNEHLRFQYATSSEEIEVFKSFINRFIIWFESDALILFEKYLSQLPTTSNSNKKKFGQPILHCNDYIEFIEYSVNSPFLRNPFIVDKLQQISKSLRAFIESYESLSYQQNLNNISFDDVKLFADENSKKAASKFIKNPSQVDAFQKVSSYFKIDQIIERSKNAKFYMKKSPDTTVDVELICLNLARHFEKDCNAFDALALLSRPSDENQSRTLIYPPFRINELSISYRNKSNELVFKVIDFAAKNEQLENCSIVIGGEESLIEWYKKLKTIFPCNEVFHRPVLIQSGSQVSASGLGINVVSSGSSSSSSTIGNAEEINDVSPPRSKSSLVDKPTISPLSRLQQQFQKPQSVTAAGDMSSKVSSHGSATSLLLDEYEDDEDEENDMTINKNLETLDLLPPSIGPYQNQSLSNSAISVSSSQSSYTKHNPPPAIRITDSSSSRKSSHSSTRYEQLVTELTNTSDQSSHVVKSIKRNTIDFENSSPSEEERPKSYRAEMCDDHSIASNSKEKKQTKNKSLLANYQSSNQSKFSSVPNLNDSKPKAKMYEVSTSSAIDISNFGKGYNPSFSIPKGLNELLKEEQEPAQHSSTSPVKTKKSLFGIFKKKKNSSNTTLVASDDTNKSKEGQKSSIPKSLSIETTLNEPTKLEASPIEAPRGISTVESSQISKSSPSASTVPSAFALPSSTSMYFFKPHSTTSVNSKNAVKYLPDEEDLVVPQELKDAINDDESIDFYISTSSPKALILSKWKPKYGKWEMITANENVFVKIVVNYNSNRSWLVFFKEEQDDEAEEEGEVYDKPILLLDLSDETATKCNALDCQITTINSITEEKMTVMIRCNSNSLLREITGNIDNMIGVLGFKGIESRGPTPSHSEFQSPETTNGVSKSLLSSSTITSSIMDNATIPFNQSSTYSSVNSNMNSNTFPKPTQSSYALDTIKDYDHISILNNPENTKVLLLHSMKIRLQKNLESYSQIHNPSSWKILSMNNLSIYMISDVITNAHYYNLVVEGTENYNWLINKEEKFNVIEKIGKAGMVLKFAEDEIFLIECKGKKEFKTLFELF